MFGFTKRISVTLKAIAGAAILTAGLAGASAPAKANDLGTLLGAATGGFIGSKVGRGSGQLAAVAIGTLAGAAIGNSISNAHQPYYGKPAHAKPVHVQPAYVAPKHVAPSVKKKAYRKGYKRGYRHALNGRPFQGHGNGRPYLRGYEQGFAEGRHALARSYVHPSSFGHGANTVIVDRQVVVAQPIVVSDPYAAAPVQQARQWAFDANGNRICRPYGNVVEINGQLQSVSGTACKLEDGRWRILN